MENHKELVDLSQLPQAKGWAKPGATLYQGCWIRSHLLPNVVAFQQQFRAEDDDVVLASHPKSGTTWLKALLFSVLNRRRYAPPESPLLAENPHLLVPFFDIFPRGGDYSSAAGRRRLFSVHIPYALLPAGFHVSKSRVVYICRNPLDTITSFWNFSRRGLPGSHGPEWTIEDCVETFCKGESVFGPFWDHVLGFWKASLESPERILFLKYEDMLEDTATGVKRIAEFLGFPFSDEEERSGVIGQIIELCSLKNLKELDVNKHGNHRDFRYELHFRKGEIGDWVNHISPSMAEKVKNLVEEKLSGSGLTFKYSLD